MTTAEAGKLARVPKLHEFLTHPHRYKVLKGGRGGLKSWSAARTLLIMGTQRRMRILCAREHQVSIAESVHKLLSDQIALLGMTEYTVLKSSIVCENGTEFLFAGLRHNISNIKSLESIDVCWIEEADQVSSDSWQTLIPSIRKPGSEIWITFNPRLETDPTMQRFVLAQPPPPDCVVVHTTYLDNPWLPEVLRVEAEYLKEHDPKTYQHVWLGECRSAIEGAIYAEEIKKAEAEGRICSVAIDRTRPVDTYWDLGYGDKTAIWFVQSYGGWYNFIDYLENSAKTIEWYVIQLQNKGYLYGKDWVPHDSVDTIIHARLAGDRSRSIEMLLRGAGRNVRVAPKLYVADGINAGRTIFGQCRFDKTRCADGLQALRHYQWGPVSLNGTEPRKPLHTWASHGSDAYRVAASLLKQPEPVRQQMMPAPPSGDRSWMA